MSDDELYPTPDDYDNYTMKESPTYTPPKVWQWNQDEENRFSKINRPIAGATHDKDLPVGEHPLQLYSLATPNGVKAGVMFEELLALGKDAELSERFMREARTASSIRHPGIIEVQDVDRDEDGALYIVMELLEGRSLKDRMKDGPMAPAEALPIFEQIVRGLRHAHRAGLVHRDIKPHNLVLTNTDVTGEREPRFKIIDLGACACFRTGMNFAPDETIMDPKYAPPEEFLIPSDDAPDIRKLFGPVALAGHDGVQRRIDIGRLAAIALIEVVHVLSPRGLDPDRLGVGDEAHDVEEVTALLDQGAPGVAIETVPVADLHEEGKAVFADRDHLHRTGHTGGQLGEQGGGRRHVAVFETHPHHPVGRAGLSGIDHPLAVLHRGAQRLLHQHVKVALEHVAEHVDMGHVRRGDHHRVAAPARLVELPRQDLTVQDGDGAKVCDDVEDDDERRERPGRA